MQFTDKEKQLICTYCYSVICSRSQPHMQMFKLQNQKIMALGQAVCKWVKPCLECWYPIPEHSSIPLCFWSCSLLMGLEKQCKCPSVWAPTSHMGDLNGVCGYWLWARKHTYIYTHAHTHPTHTPLDLARLQLISMTVSYKFIRK